MKSTTPVLLGTVVFSALLYRISSSAGYYHKADATVIATMADDIAKGIAFPFVYYGQYYMGSVEAWITAPLFFITGPTWWGVSFAPILVSAIGVIPFYLLGRSAGGSSTGIAAALLWAITPFAVNFYNITPRGCYPEVVCGGSALLWYATQRWKGEKFSLTASWLFGLLSGLLLWTSLLSLPYIATTFLFMALGDRPRVFNRANAAMLLGFAIGATPFLLILPSYGGVSELSLLQFGERISALVSTAKSLFLPYSAMNPPAVLYYLGWAVFLIMVSSMAVVFVLSAVNSKFISRDCRRNPILPLIIFTLMFTALYFLNDKSLQQQSRYLLPLFTPLIITTAIVAGSLWKWRRLPAIAFLGLILTADFTINVFTFRIVKSKSENEKRFVERALRKFEKIGLKSVVWVDYERVHMMNYLARINDVELHGMSNDGSRYERVTRMVEKDPDTGVVLTGAPEKLKRQLELCCGDDYKVDKVIKWEVLSRMRPVRWPAESIPPSQWKIKKGLKPLSDRKFTTTFAGNASFTVELKRSRPITRIRVIFGESYPGLISVKASLDGEHWNMISAYTGPFIFVPVGPKVFVRTMLDYSREYQEWNFPPIEARFIKFDIKHPADKLYNIHELFIYRHIQSGRVENESDIKAICKKAKKSGVEILAVNRWVAANFYDQCDGSFHYVRPTIKPVNDPFQKSRMDAVIGFGALVGDSDRNELMQRLKNRKTEFVTEALDDYTLFIMRGNFGEVWWTGFTMIDY